MITTAILLFRLSARILGILVRFGRRLKSACRRGTSLAIRKWWFGGGGRGEGGSEAKIRRKAICNPPPSPLLIERSFGPQGAAAQFFYLPWFSAWKWSDLIGCNETDQPPLPRVVKGAIRFAVSDPSTVTRKWSFHGLSALGEREFHSFCAKEGEKISRSVYGLREGKGRGLGTIGLSVLNNCYLDGKLTKSARQLGLLTPLPPFLFLFHPLVRPLRKQPIRPVRALKT